MEKYILSLAYSAKIPPKEGPEPITPDKLVFDRDVIRNMVVTSFGLDSSTTDDELKEMRTTFTSPFVTKNDDDDGLYSFTYDLVEAQIKDYERSFEDLNSEVILKAGLDHIKWEFGYNITKVQFVTLDSVPDEEEIEKHRIRFSRELPYFEYWKEYSVVPVKSLDIALLDETNLPKSSIKSSHNVSLGGQEYVVHVRDTDPDEWVQILESYIASYCPTLVSNYDIIEIALGAFVKLVERENEVDDLRLIFLDKLNLESGVGGGGLEMGDIPGFTPSKGFLSSLGEFTLGNKMMEAEDNILSKLSDLYMEIDREEDQT